VKLALLTTDTLHHRYFAREVAARLPWTIIVLETVSVVPPFDTFHPYEERRHEFEQEVLLGGQPGEFREVAETHAVANINSPEAVELLKRAAADVAIVFGTGLCRTQVIETAGLMCLNLHGGNPEQYRGLDTHLWAIYHGDYGNLVTTLHYLNKEIDAGDMVMQAQLELRRGMEMHELRAVNARTCVQLVTLALGALASGIALPRRSQVARGRYYSFMPSVLKDVCVRKFGTHLAKL
jgi:methionyl-tRNA formyltransferase